MLILPLTIITVEIQIIAFVRIEIMMKITQVSFARLPVSSASSVRKLTSLGNDSEQIPNRWHFRGVMKYIGTTCGGLWGISMFGNNQRKCVTLHLAHHLTAFHPLSENSRMYLDFHTAVCNSHDIAKAKCCFCFSQLQNSWQISLLNCYFADIFHITKLLFCWHIINVILLTYFTYGIQYFSYFCSKT